MHVWLTLHGNFQVCSMSKIFDHIWAWCEYDPCLQVLSIIYVFKNKVLQGVTDVADDDIINIYADRFRIHYGTLPWKSKREKRASKASVYLPSRNILSSCFNEPRSVMLNSSRGLIVRFSLLGNFFAFWVEL